MRRTAFFVALVGAATFAVAGSETTGLRASLKDDHAKEWKVSGQLYGYFQYSFGDPGSGDNVLGRKYDNRHDQIRLSNVKVKFLREADGKLPFVIRATIWGGDDSDLSFKGETTGSTLVEHVRVLEVGIPLKGIEKGELTLGKFDLPMGYEPGDTDKTAFFGTGLLRTLTLPTFGTGARLNFGLAGGATASAYVVNGWNETTNPNERPAFAVTVKKNQGRYRGGLGVYAGSEGAGRENNGGTFGGAKLGNAGGTNLQVYNAYLATNVSNRAELALETSVRIQEEPNERRIHAGAVFFKYNVGRGWEAGVRGELASFYADGDQTERRYALTGTISRRFGNGHRLMLELRRDTSNDPVFVDKNGSTDKQGTITLAYGLKF